MTRDEIVAALLNDWEIPYLQDWQAREIVDFVIKNYKPSIPSNLDEAAEESSKNTYPYEDDSHVYDRVLVDEARAYHECGFKAGAEWMAGQGYTKEETVYFERLCDENRIMVDLGWGEPERGGFNPGDKVVVQIRKALENEEIVNRR